MKSFGDFIFECNESLIKDANFVLENFIKGDITLEQFSFLLSEGKFDREKAFEIMWNDFSTDPEINQELRRAAELLDTIDSPEPKKYLKKGSKDINPEWKEWKKNQSDDPEEDSRGAQIFLSRAAELIKQKIDDVKDDPDHPLNFKNADENNFAMGRGDTERKRDKDASSYYGQLEANIGAIIGATAEKKTRNAIKNSWTVSPAGATSSELSTTVKRGGEGRTSGTSKADWKIEGPNGETIRVSGKQGDATDYSTSESGTMRGVGAIVAKAMSKKEMQYRPSKKQSGETDAEYKERQSQEKSEVRQRQRERESELLAKSDRVASAVDYRGRDSNEIERRKSQASDAESNLEPEQKRRITQAHASGEGQFRSKEGEAQVMVKTPGVQPERKGSRDNPDYGKPIEDDGSSVKQAKFAQTATGAPRKGRSETRPMTVAYRSPSASKETGVKTGNQTTFSQFTARSDTPQQRGEREQNASRREQQATEREARRRQILQKRIGSLPSRFQAQALRNAQARERFSSELNQE